MTNHLTEAQERERLADLIAIYRPASDKVIADKSRMPGLVAAPLTISSEDMRVMLNALAAKADATTSAAGEVTARIEELTPLLDVVYKALQDNDCLGGVMAMEKVLAWCQHAARPVAQADAGAMTERDHWDYSLWQQKLVKLADEYYATGSTSEARRRARANLVYHALDCATGWRARSALAASAQATQAVEPVAPWAWHVEYPVGNDKTAVHVKANELDALDLKRRYFDVVITPLVPAPTTAQEAEPTRNEALEDAIKACENEYLCDPEGTEDIAYDQAVRDCINAIRAIITNELESAQEAEPAKAAPDPSRCRNRNCGQWVDNCDFPDCRTAAQEGGQAKGVGDA